MRFVELVMVTSFRKRGWGSNGQAGSLSDTTHDSRHTLLVHSMMYGARQQIPR
jgi:hypothetical protein